MRAGFGCLLLALLGTALGQVFPNGFSYDYNISSVTTSCQSALSGKVDCSWLLVLVDTDSIELSKENLTSICTSECYDSLATRRNVIELACPISNNQVVAGGIAYPLMQRIDSLLSTYNKTCLIDTETDTFCYDVMRPWQTETALSSAQNCSYCMLRTLQLGQSSDFSYNEDFAHEFSFLTSSCGASGFDYVTPTPIAINGSSITIGTTTVTPTPSCASTYTIQAADSCNSICKSHNVSTYALLTTNHLQAYCTDFPDAGIELCMPPSCDIYTVEENDTCQSVAVKQPSYITITQLQAWNPNLNSLCTNMAQQVGMQICISPPGENLPAPTSTTPVVTTPAPLPTSIANGTTTRCAKYYTVQPGDECSRITMQANPPISIADFYFLNPGVNATCGNLILGKSYCIQPVGDITTYPGYGFDDPSICDASSCYGDYATLSPTPFPGLTGLPTATPTTAKSSLTLPPYTPSPIAPGTNPASNCSHYVGFAETGDEDTNAYVNSCSSVADFYGITTDVLKEWNPILHDAEPCTLSRKYRYCVRVNGNVIPTTMTATTTSFTSSTTVTPTPTQEGMVLNCNRFYKVVDNDGCWDIANNHGITTDQFHAWNPAVQDDCSKLWPNYYVCVGVTVEISSTTRELVTTTSSSSTGIPTPSPSSPGMPIGCIQFYRGHSGDYCSKICEINGISVENFVRWNPDVKSDCSLVRLGYYYCIAH